MAKELFVEKIEASSSSEQSSVWNHFAKHKVVGQASCKYCNKKLKWNGSTTSNIRDYVKKFHSAAVPDQKPHGLVSARKPSPSLVRSNSFPLPSRKTEPGVTQITNFFSSPFMLRCKMETDNRASVGMVCRRHATSLNNHDEGLYAVLAFVDPNYRVPSRTHLAALLRRKRECTQEILKKGLEKSEAFSMTTDLWTSHTGEEFAAFTCHFISHVWKLVSYLMRVSHTAQNIMDQVLGCLANFGIPSEKRFHSCMITQATWYQLATNTWKRLKALRTFCAQRIAFNFALRMPLIRSLLCPAVCSKSVGWPLSYE